MKDLLMIVGFLFCMACGQPESEFVGKWENTQTSTHYWSENKKEFFGSKPEQYDFGIFGKTKAEEYFEVEQKIVSTVTITHNTRNQYFFQGSFCITYSPPKDAQRLSVDKESFCKDFDQEAVVYQDGILMSPESQETITIDKKNGKLFAGGKEYTRK